MKHQALFSLKDKKVKVSSAAILLGSLRVKSMLEGQGMAPVAHSMN